MDAINFTRTADKRLPYCDVKGDRRKLIQNFQKSLAPYEEKYREILIRMYHGDWDVVRKLVIDAEQHFAYKTLTQKELDDTPISHLNCMRGGQQRFANILESQNISTCRDFQEFTDSQLKQIHQISATTVGRIRSEIAIMQREVDEASEYIATGKLHRE